MARGGLSRLAIERLKSAGVPLAPLLKRLALAPEVIADPEERMSVRSQIALLDEAAIALKDDCLGFTLARDFDLREIGLLYYVMAWTPSGAANCVDAANSLARASSGASSKRSRFLGATSGSRVRRPAFCSSPFRRGSRSSLQLPNQITYQTRSPSFLINTPHLAVSASRSAKSALPSASNK